MRIGDRVFIASHGLFGTIVDVEITSVGTRLIPQALVNLEVQLEGEARQMWFNANNVGLAASPVYTSCEADKDDGCDPEEISALIIQDRIKRHRDCRKSVVTIRQKPSFFPSPSEMGPKRREKRYG